MARERGASHAREATAVPTLHTDRLLLTPIEPALSRGVFDLWSHPQVYRYSGEIVDYDGNVIDTPCTTESQSDRPRQRDIGERQEAEADVGES